MKKLLTFSLIGTIAIVILGAMFIFGVLDLNMGQNNLIGLNNESVNEIELHNSIVEDVHELGNHANNIIGIFKGLTPDSKLNTLQKETEEYNKHLQNLERYILPNFSKDRADVYQYFSDSYLPQIHACGKTIENALRDFKENGITQEKINLVIEGITPKHEAFVFTHNEFVEILNKNR